MDYDTKLTKCKLCGSVNILKYHFLSNRDNWFWNKTEVLFHFDEDEDKEEDEDFDE